jgi:hypothetical protein
MSLFAVLRPGQPEVENSRFVSVVHQNVLRLEIPMNDQFAVDVFQSFEYTVRDSGKSFPLVFAPEVFEPLIERGPADQLHGVERLAAAVAIFMGFDQKRVAALGV